MTLLPRSSPVTDTTLTLELSVSSSGRILDHSFNTLEFKVPLDDSLVSGRFSFKLRSLTSVSTFSNPISLQLRLILLLFRN